MLSTYGLEGPAENLRRLIERRPQLQQMVCYGSGYPSWDTQWPKESESLFPAEWHADVFQGNADRWFRWQPDDRRPVDAAREMIQA
jgi:hypothetical protein